MSYQLGVDLGATRTAGAVYRSGRAEVVPLGAHTATVPTVVFVNEDGSLTVGEKAEPHALAGPGRIARRFAGRVGDNTPLLVGDVPIAAETLVARFVAQVGATVASRVGGAPSRVALTHPAGWGQHRLAALRAALTSEGLGTALFVPAPCAAALASGEPGPVAVYDLGGTSLEVAVVRRLPDGEFAIAGRPEELEIGGLDFDELVFEHVRMALGAAWDELDPTDPATLPAVAALRRACTAAKEELSTRTEVRIPVALPATTTEVRLTRAEFEELIREPVAETAAVLHRAIGAANEVAAVVLTGGSARIPLVTQVISAQLGRPVTVAPEGAAAMGAALAAGRLDVAAATAIVAAPPRPPSIPVGPPPVSRPVRRWRDLSRTAITAAAAGLVTIAATSAVVLASRTTPGEADADPVVTTSSTVPVTSTTTTPYEPPPQPAPPPTKTKRAEPPPPRTTTTTTTTTEPPTSTTTTTTTWSTPPDTAETVQEPAQPSEDRP